MQRVVLGSECVMLGKCLTPSCCELNSVSGRKWLGGLGETQVLKVKLSGSPSSERVIGPYVHTCMNPLTVSHTEQAAVCAHLFTQFPSSLLVRDYTYKGASKAHKNCVL